MKKLYNKKPRIIVITIIIFCTLLIAKIGYIAINNVKEKNFNYSNFDNLVEEQLNNIFIAPINSIIFSGKKEIKFNDVNLYNLVVEQLDNSFEIKRDDQNYTIIMDSSELEKVTTLNLNNNNISDISGLENFTELTELNISNNNIADISVLSALTNLKVLNAYGNKISDLTFISSLINLEYLNIAKNKLEDTDSENTVTNLISNLTNLTELDMSHNYLKYTIGLDKLVKLKKLNLYDNSIHDLNGLATLTNLEELNLGENNENGNSSILGLDSLQNLVNLTYLNFSENKTSTILNYINNLTNLETLNLESNILEDISSISSLSKLKKLNLYDNKVTSIAPLLTLSNLEELIIQKNTITDLTGIINGNELIWKNLKKLDIANNNINTSTNSDVIQMLCEKSGNETLELNYEDITDTSALPHYDENGVAYVTYDDFGARCNGIYDDFIAIKNAHNYANKYGYKVKATAGKTYHIFKFYEDAVTVKTSTNWDNANFIIHDEKIEEVSGRYKSLFEVNNMKDTLTINNPTWTIGTETKKITELEGKLNTLNKKGYTKYLCVATNSNKKQYIRYGSNSNSGDSQQDYFLIDGEGNVLNDIQWDFDEITGFRIYPIQNLEMRIENGNFISNALTSQSEATYSRPGSGKSVYFSRNIYVKGSNIRLSNINHNLSYEKDKDEISGSYKGFIYTIFCADIDITDCSLFTRKYSMDGRSTYDLNVYASVNVNCKNITSNNIGDADRWGIVATYFAKDVLFENCTLNRIDTHQGIYNLTVKDCIVGSKGLTMTGQGNLNVINTEVSSASFINLRSDYGSTWNGNVNIIDCTYRPKDTLLPKLVFSNLSYDNYNLHDFGYDCKMPNINICNLTIDMQNVKDCNYCGCIYIGNIKTETSYNDNTKKYLQNYLPNSIVINGYNFINAENNSTINIANKNLTSYLNDYNYVITDTKLKLNDENGENIINKTNSGDNFITKDSVYLEINENNSAENFVSLYKDGNAIFENMLVDDMYKYMFTDSGAYKVLLSSVDNVYSLNGNQIYEFIVDNEAPEIKNVENEKIYEKVTPIVEDNNLDKLTLMKDDIIQENYKNGDEISEKGKYVITAVDKAGNVTTVNFIVLPKAIKDEKIDINSTLVWNDNNNEANKRPNSIILELYANGTLKDSYKIIDTSNNTQSYTFKDLPRYDDLGDEISYTVDEKEVNEGDLKFYNKNIDDNTNTVINTFTVPDEKINVSSTLVWDDNNNEANKRPSSIRLKLYANGTGNSYYILNNTTSNTFSYVFEDLPKYDRLGNEISYTVDEEEIDENALTFYTKSVDSKTNTITNKFTVPDEKTSVTVTVNWNDNSNINKARPQSMKVYLKNGDTSVQEYTFVDTTKNTQSHEFTDLAKYDNLGNEISYIADIAEVIGYEKIISGTTIENTIKSYDITTKIEENGGKVLGQDETPYEVVTYYGTNKKDIKITPDYGYKISNITVNGDKIGFTPNQDGTYTLDKFVNIKENKDIVVTFEKKDSRVVVRYVTGEDEDLVPQEVIEGKVGDNYSSSAKEFDEYDLKLTPDNANGTMTEEPIVVKYEYSLVKGSITIKLVDKDDETKVLSGAKFKIEKLNEDGSVDDTFTAIEKTVGEDGIVKFTNLAIGKYKITQIGTIDGYRVDDTALEIQISKNERDIYITTQNKHISEVLQTVNTGDILVSIVAIILICITTFVITSKKFKSKKD